jgi:hypothetical protein
MFARCKGPPDQLGLHVAKKQHGRVEHEGSISKGIDASEQLISEVSDVGHEASVEMLEELDDWELDDLVGSAISPRACRKRGSLMPDTDSYSPPRK